VRRWACDESCVARTIASNRCALRSALAVSDATTWQNRTSLSEKGRASRSVRRKIAPMTAPLHRMGATTIDRTLRMSRSARMSRSIGSAVASGMNTVSPESNARCNSG